jgi:catechol 2,3-dioxygenase-like lactoylglutathione lyase family enzyme
MLADTTYRQWASAFRKGSYADGNWKEGGIMQFLTPDRNGMVSRVISHRPAEFLALEHLGTIEHGKRRLGGEWAGAKETYSVYDANGAATLTIDTDTPEADREAFEDAWPRALLRLKELAEVQFIERKVDGEHMLAYTNATANLAVKDLARARRFYEETLGLHEVDSQDGEVIVYGSGDTRINVYRSEYAGTNKATAVTWAVGGDLEKTVRSLKDKGVRFEHYDLPGMKRNGDIHEAGPMKVAWFKDPDGNILNLVN